jgi:general nucleoside transport system permease protein
MDWSLILKWSFLISLIAAGIRLALPLLITVLGEIVTESSGVLNLGLEGVMAMGGVVGFMTSFYLSKGILANAHDLAICLGLLAGLLAGVAMGFLKSFLSITLRADQVIAGVTLVVFGVGVSNYIYRQAFNTLSENMIGLPIIHIPFLSDIPVVGDILFKHDAVFFLTLFLVWATWYFLFRTTWGLNIRAVGENPAAADTSGIKVEFTRYIATLIGSAFAGLGGAVLVVDQLGLFREGITAGKGWIAVALVIFARWRPKYALYGALLFGLADSIQYRIQALSQIGLGMKTVPYEFMLMLPYVLTIVALFVRSNRASDQPAMLGRPYIKGER